MNMSGLFRGSAYSGIGRIGDQGHLAHLRIAGGNDSRVGRSHVANRWTGFRNPPELPGLYPNLGADTAGTTPYGTLLEAQLYGLDAMDPFVLTAVAGVVGFVVLIACSVPARRAARIDPLTALADQ